MKPPLNQLEIAKIADELHPALEGLFIDRLLVPERPRFKSQFLKGEWALRITGKRDAGLLLLSVRPQHVYVSYLSEKNIKSAQAGTRSPFDLAAGKFLKGGRIRAVKSWPHERILCIEIDSGGLQLTLALLLIPAHPEALILERDTRKILARSQMNRGKEALDSHSEVWQPPALRSQASSPPASGKKVHLEIRPSLAKSLEEFSLEVESQLELEAFELRRVDAARKAKEILKQAKARWSDSSSASEKAAKEADWGRYGTLLKAHLSDPPALVKKSPQLSVRVVLDYASDEKVEIPCDPQLEPKAQVEKFFSLARRKARRLEEATGRAEGFHETMKKMEAVLGRIEALAEPKKIAPWADLSELERSVGLEPAERTKTSASGSGGKSKSGSTWLGKRFHSTDGSAILVGRTKDENLELTFKHARGNDIWMHVRGKPGAHVVIPLNSGKSASLNTLLDAAHLCIYYSKGESWGKTEVDYAFKKHVKRIKDSTEASYTHNKTLVVELDQARLKRLIGQNP